MLTAVDTTSRRAERAFSVVELIIAASLLAIALGGAVAVAASGSRSETSSTVRQTQLAVLSSAAEKLRSDSTWAPQEGNRCSSAPAPIDLTSWLTQRLDRELAADAVRASQFLMSATASPVDAAADGQCPNDADGIVPDYYDVEIVTRPDDDTASRMSSVAPITQRFHIDFSSRTTGGRLSIQACYVWPQRDDRLALSSCELTSEPVKLQPSAKVLNPARPNDCRESFECIPFLCADPARHASCPFGQNGREEYVSTETRPADGWTYTVTGIDPVTSQEPPVTGTLDDVGRAVLDGVVPGRYRIDIDHPSEVVPWTSHSVPASGIATVERGVRSRVVQMFQPAPRGDSVRVNFVYYNGFVPPWMRTPITTYSGSSSSVWEIVSAPLGRTTEHYRAQQRFGGPSYVEFEGVHPGLYSFQLLTPFRPMQIERQFGFFYVPPGDGSALGPNGVTLELRGTITCRNTLHEELIAQYGDGAVLTNPANPAETFTLRECTGHDDEDYDGGDGTT